MKNILDYTAKLVFVFFLSFFFYGLYLYSDAPIQPCGENSYCGKQGQPHTYEDYVAYNRHYSIVPWLFALSVLSMAYLNRRKYNNIFNKK